MNKRKGEYVICVEDDDIVYSTDSPFWRDFFSIPVNSRYTVEKE